MVRALSWNLFHGRDHPPDPALLTWRSRLLRTSERNATHVQVNRELLAEFADVLASTQWNIALLQECPPRWCDALARECDALAHRALTSRNSLAPLRSLLARANPDLIASGEGGSNLTLVRSGAIGARRELELRPGPRPERRVMAFSEVRIAGIDLCVANLHASAGDPALAEADLRLAAARATAWAGGTPLVFGGDLNVRPRGSAVYDELRERYGLAGPTAPAALDHLLVRGLDVIGAPAQWGPARREVHEANLAIRLSDHAPVEAVFAPPTPREARA